MEEGFGSERQSDHLLVAMVLNQEQTHDFGSVFRVQGLDSGEDDSGRFVGIHGRTVAEKGKDRESEEDPRILSMSSAAERKHEKVKKGRERSERKKSYLSKSNDDIRKQKMKKRGISYLYLFLLSVWI